MCGVVNEKELPILSFYDTIILFKNQNSTLLTCLDELRFYLPILFVMSQSNASGAGVYIPIYLGISLTFLALGSLLGLLLKKIRKILEISLEGAIIASETSLLGTFFKRVRGCCKRIKSLIRYSSFEFL
ncbi:hypothetical protein [Streptococcus acidominimus]|uniref:Uncharacterized protein n=1 Tax=Streptococcus acidominimus TaxID=1326 RepID=A0A4Y9FL74_STRAI|nr:hypothetical protein [Streptococcus acidominimus]MBF0819507.1 hypothetical protein [Streptococcus acidominimus]MBF0838097.1 hypothetical protein [Streptococcus acidominimus]MBF0846452.1 hypothetical protein [Streptococcus danieliae]TFU29796.1 hypothetical protein E4U01_08630 [Streptococcus acidominimus]